MRRTLCAALLTRTVLLFFVSGLPLAEKPSSTKYYLMTHGARPLEGVDKWDEYQAYLARTSILIPFPPSIYRSFPSVLKRTLLLDLPMFAFDETRDGPGAIETELKATE